MELFKTIAEGGQIWAHRVRMVRQVIRIALLASCVSGCVFFAYRMYLIPQLYYQAIWYYGQTKLLGSPDELIFVDGVFWQQAERQRIQDKTIAVKAKKLEKVCETKVQFFFAKTIENVKGAASVFFAVFAVLIFFFLVKGLRSRKKKHIDGQKTASPWEIATKLKLTRKASHIKIGSLPLVKGTETRHILISGGTGSGKTNCFHHILPQIRKKKQRAIVVDTSGEFVSKYFREGKDILINPFDQRSVKWHPWCECTNSYDYKSLAQSFIPSTHSEDENFWRKAAQEVFCATLQVKESEKRISEVVRLLLYDSLTTLYDYLRDTKAVPFLDPSSEKTAGSIRAVAASFLECLELFEDTDAPFSIRDWVGNEQEDRWLFFSSTIGQRATLTPLLSAWFSIAMRSLIQLEPSKDRRLWFIADELPSLNKLRDLETCLTESRKFGGCALLAFQSPAQLEVIYGREITSIITGNCATKIAFAEQDPIIASRISKTFGEKEIKEFQEAISYGAHEMRDGVNLSFQSRSSPVVSSTAIQSLNVNEAFVKLPGDLPITQLKLGYREILQICKNFMPNGSGI